MAALGVVHHDVGGAGGRVGALGGRGAEDSPEGVLGIRQEAVGEVEATFHGPEV